MIETRLYLKALKIVNAYHEQTLATSKEVMELIEPKQKFKDLKEVTHGDTVKCIFVHSASTNHLTRDKEYEVLNIDSYRFLIKTDSGTKKWYHKDNGHFRLLA